MQNLHFIVALDASARFVHLFLAQDVDLPMDCEELVGQSLGVPGNAGLVLYGVRHGLAALPKLRPTMGLRRVVASKERIWGATGQWPLCAACDVAAAIWRPSRLTRH